jgi:hypothetical protein
MSINYNICRICVSYLGDHPTLKDWLKCPSCGFSKVKKPIITLEAYLMGRDKQYPAEFTQELLLNATIFLEKVNALLWNLGIKEAAVSSGWRPAVVNSGVANAAKRSLHMTCKAIDIKDDKSQSLANKVLTKPELLKSLDLWLEDPAATRGKNTNWVHLDMGIRTDRPLRMFKP